MRNRQLPLTGIAVCSLLAVSILAFNVFLRWNDAQPTSNTGPVANGYAGSSTATPIAHYGAEHGSVNDSLISPDNVTFHVVEIQRGTTKWMFHIHSHNNTSKDVTILDALTDRYFMVAGKGTPGTPITANEMFLRLTPPGEADQATHPAHPTSLVSNADGDGWLVADLTNYKYQPIIQLFYVYGTVLGTACANPSDKSTCHSDVGYRTISWQL